LATVVNFEAAEPLRRIIQVKSGRLNYEERLLCKATFDRLQDAGVSQYSNSYQLASALLAIPHANYRQLGS